MGTPKKKKKKEKVFELEIKWGWGKQYGIGGDVVCSCRYRIYINIYRSSESVFYPERRNQKRVASSMYLMLMKSDLSWNGRGGERLSSRVSEMKIDQ